MVLSAALGGTAAHAASLFAETPTVTVAVAAAESQAQLAKTLAAEGYAAIALSAIQPSLENPHPELNPAALANPTGTPVREGWNGVAEKDGQIVQVYVTGL
jgi:hypothetical protein